MSNCRAVELLNQIAAKMSVLDDALAIVNGVIKRLKKDRLRKQKFHGNNNFRGNKENENEKENIPPTPPIREKEKEKEKNKRESTIRAREEELHFGDDPKVIEAKEQMEQLPKQPTWDEVWNWVKSHDPIKYPEDVVREWYDERDFAGWRNQDGKPIGNWQFDMQRWKMFLPVRKRNADPDRIPDARKKSKSNRPHANNWRGTRKEDLEDVL